jgi:Fe-S-cluster containining protein
MRPFERTSCACYQCTDCCKRQPGSLAPGDMERIAAHLGKTLDEVKPMFWASPGPMVGNAVTGRRWYIGSITPRYDKRKKRCVFLDDDDRCTIHAVAPAGCAIFDTHMGVAEAYPRSQWLAHEQSRPDYQSLRATLDLATHSKPVRY